MLKRSIKKMLRPIVARLISSIDFYENMEGLSTVQDRHESQLIEIQHRIGYTRGGLSTVQDRHESQLVEIQHRISNAIEELSTAQSRQESQLVETLQGFSTPSEVKLAWAQDRVVSKNGVESHEVKLKYVSDARIGTIFFPEYDETISGWIAGHGTWDEDICNLLISKFRAGQTLLNIGSNVGYFSILGARLLGNTGQVIAIEPHPIISKIARLNYETQFLQNVTHFEVAAGNANDIQHLVCSDFNSGDNRLWGDSTLQHYEVDVRILDDLLKLDRLDFVISDAQGWDYRALQGLKKNILQFKPIIIAEFMPEWITAIGDDPEDVLSEYSRWGYTVSALGYKNAPEGQDLIEWMKSNDLIEINVLLTPR